MKKKYSKPDIVYEDFTPSASIAAGCGYKANAALYECGIPYPPFMLFQEGVVGCDLYVSSVPGMLDDICYHAPDPGNNVFTS